MIDLRALVESAHDSTGRVGMRERLDLASAPAAREVFSLASPLGSPAGYGRPACKGAG